MAIFENEQLITSENENANNHLVSGVLLLLGLCQQLRHRSGLS